MISRLGSMLVREGLLTPAQHLAAVEEAEDTASPFVSVLIRMGFVSEDRLVELTRDRLLVPEATREAIENADPNAVELVPPRMAQQFLVCPLAFDPVTGLTLLMADASDRHATDEVSYHTGQRVLRTVASEPAVRWAIQRHYGLDMSQPLAPWEQSPEEAVVLLTKVKRTAAAPPPPRPQPVRPPPVAPARSDSNPAEDVLLLTPQMRRSSGAMASFGADAPPAPAPPPAPPGVAASPPPAAPPPKSRQMPPAPPPEAPSPLPPPEEPTVPPLPDPGTEGRSDSPHETAPSRASDDVGALPAPRAVPPLPEPPPAVHSATGREPARSQARPYKQGARRKRQETIQGLPNLRAARAREAEAYSSGADERSSDVPTKILVPRAEVEIVQRSAPEARSDAGLWSGSARPHPPSDEGARSEAFSSASLALKRARSRDDVGRILFGYFQEFFLNVALFVLRREQILGWDADGIRLTREKIRSISIPTDQQSTFRDVIQSRLPRRGRLDATPADIKFQESIGYQPTDVSLVPLTIREKVIGIIYSDGVLAPLREEEVSALLSHVEAAYERVILQSRFS